MKRRRTLLLLACSATKRDQPMHAVELYDGPAYRIARKRLFPVQACTPSLRILSAEHGLISPFRLTAPYDRKMDEARAAELADADEADLRRELYLPYQRHREQRQHFGPYDQVFAFGGELYRRVIEAWAERGVFDGAEISYTSGGIGEQLGQLAAWMDAELARGSQTFPTAA